MAKNDKKPSADAQAAQTSETPEATSTEAETQVSEAQIAELFEDTKSEEPAQVAVLVAGAPASAMTQAQVTAAGDIGSRIAQYEGKLADLEGQILSIGDKYPEWMESLLETMSRYGMSNADDAFDVSVNAPLTYIRLRHGNSKNVPKGMNIEPGDFFTAEKKLGDTFEAMLIYAHDSRKFFPGGAELGAPECQSHDGKFGSRYGNCNECPYSQFDEAKKKSPCGRAFAVMLATPDFSTIGELTFKGTAMAAGRQFLQRMKMIQGAGEGGTKLRGSAMWVTEIKSVENTSGGFTNAIPTGGLPKTPTTEQQREVLELLSKFFKLRAMTFIARGEQRRAAKSLSGGAKTSGAIGGGGADGAGGNAEAEIPLL
jgi:hypothetical protein